MQGDELMWHWEIPSSHPFEHGIDSGFREGFSGAAAPTSESDAEASAYQVGRDARAELLDETRHFSDLRVYLAADDRIAYELSERTG